MPPLVHVYARGAKAKLGNYNVCLYRRIFAGENKGGVFTFNIVEIKLSPRPPKEGAGEAIYKPKL